MSSTRLKRKTKQNRILIGFGILAAIGFVISIPDLMGKQEVANRLRAKRDAAKYRAIELKLDHSIAAEEAAIAQKMFKDGCTIALKKTKYTDLKTGMKIPLPDGTRVCSRKGNIGTVVNGKLSKVLYDGRPEHLNGNHTRVYNGSIELE
jgi:hypothetical protein